ncbi:class I adenylate-forming enzyme family protein [Croceicoccus sp. YJ47]|uniref:class I adenylate-forming enzyme family protein n=1 Tax=Croceicoccus sp. YJ47 TaxID=2798724 RepID=UPI0019229F30|nr:AMP-binding protein [Croceicoccus sp. YJ47]QQN74395.1 AMP-binding protein [Croceicoccus sp. YJ47]
MSQMGLIHDGLDYWARRTPEKMAFSFDGEDALTYGELAKWSDGLAEHLQSQDVRPGDRVAIAAANSLEWIASAFAIAKSGGIIVPFNDRLVGLELHYLASDSDPRLIIADSERAERMVKAGVTATIMPIDHVSQFRGGATDGWQQVRRESEDVAMIIFTSGSTSRPKGAMMTHGSYLLKFTEMLLLDNRIGAETRSLMPFGLHSSPGLPWGQMFTTIVGGTLYFTQKYSTEKILRLLAQERITFFIGVPMIYDQLADLPQFADADLSHLTFARIGGATPTRETLARWMEKGIALRQLYGMSEVGGGAIIASEAEARARPDSCGRGLALSRFRIQRDDGSPCDPGEAGHILLTGPGLMKAYWNKPEETSAALQDGWMHTGDIGMVDEEGYFHFIDRSKEMIKSGGFNVSPAEIEGIISQHPAIAEVAVFGVQDADYAEAIFACARCNAALEEQELFDWCAERMAGYKLPRYVELTDKPLPRLANEKVDRQQLKRTYAAVSNRRDRLRSGIG